MYRMNKDADEVLAFIKSDLFYGLAALLEFIMCIGITAFISPLLSLLSLALVIITFSLSNLFKKKLKPIYNKVAKMTALNQFWLLEFLGGMRDIRLLNAIKYCRDKYLNQEKEIIEANKVIVKKETLLERTNAAIQVCASLGIFTIGAVHIVSGSLTLGGLIAIIDYYNRMIIILNRIYTKILSVSRRMISFDRIIEIEDEESETDTEYIPTKRISRGEIIFN